MKRINIRTKVHGSPREILKKFKKELLIKLTPPFVKIEITQFDGCEKGGEVHIVSSVLGNYQSWVNIIVDSFDSDEECYFVDQAREMPFPFTYWNHTHKIRRVSDEKSYIQDHIVYKCSHPVLELAVYPVVYFLMYYRKPIYLDTFNEKQL